MYNLLDFLSWGLVIYITMNLLTYFGILNKSNQIVLKIYISLMRLYEPVLFKIRKYLPQNLPIDLSPIVVFLGIELVQGIMTTYLYY
ncbi:MAG: hypothetical protein BGO27_02145 [Alphaproteobacteria bacterium 33-17]|nr:MAG: hypothetical protein BGO27_02145 [Alphaproteobacteria bacterium 33-17]